ncbi:GumC family protein [Ruegeria marina]|uniref:Uncharacterized protein involved in exopolysaccharide biosynthesis n=1 Tax=Ruegeria marina TaxID=639004 RepID=A0A1G6VKH0_9RHOB|nr:Wzz/FepE/Etk N-terminal domain-containing protein [Ruegeria marina]SDD54014.1 Uncharacterized protein involved in exopolysaccharide biosynthesis [Ruegeria marina]
MTGNGENKPPAGRRLNLEAEWLVDPATDETRASAKDVSGAGRRLPSEAALSVDPTTDETGAPAEDAPGADRRLHLESALSVGPSTDETRASAKDVSGAVWSPPDVLRLLMALGQNYLWLIVAPIIGVLATVGYLLVKNPTYEVGAQLMLKFGKEMAAPATVSAAGTQTVIPMSIRLENITAEVQIMKDPALVRTVVEELGEDYFYGEDPAVTLLQKIKKWIKDTVSETKEAIRSVLVKIGLLPELSRLDRVILLIQSVLSIEHVTRSDVIELTLSYPDPFAGEEVLGRFLDAYFEKRREIYLDKRVQDFFRNELSAVNAKLEAAEAAHAQMLKENEAWLINDQRSLAVERRAALTHDLETARAVVQIEEDRLDRIDAEISELQALIPSQSSTRRNQIKDQLRLKLVDLQLQLEAEDNRSGARSLQVQSLNEQIAHLQMMIDAEPDRVSDSVVETKNPLLDSLLAQRSAAQLTLVATKTKIETLEDDIAQIEADLETKERVGAQLENIEQDLARLRHSKQAYSQAFEDTRISSEISEALLSNVVVIAKPQGGIAPAKPRVPRTIAVGFVLSLMVASGIILVVDALRPKVRDNTDLARLVGPGVLVRAIANSRRRR